MLFSVGLHVATARTVAACEAHPHFLVVVAAGASKRPLVGQRQMYSSVSKVWTLCQRLNLEARKLLGLHSDRLFDIWGC